MILCVYGCGHEGKFFLKRAKKWCCCKSANSCEINRIKNSNKQKGRKHSELTKLKISVGNKGKEGWMKNKHHSPETIQKLKSNHFIFTEEHRRNLSKALKGKKGPKFSLETIQKIREKNIGKTRSLEFKEKISKLNKGRKRSENFKENRKQYMLNGGAEHVGKFPKKFSDTFKQKQKERMLNGQAAYMNSFISNPSKPQVELYNRVKEIYPTAILNYPLIELNYSLDVVIPELNIVIESDGSWWHQDLEKDSERQKKIEELGWKFIRYKADCIKDVPNKDQIVKDINERNA